MNIDTLDKKYRFVLKNMREDANRHKLCYNGYEAIDWFPHLSVFTNIKVDSLIKNNRLISLWDRAFFCIGFFSDYFPKHNNQSNSTKKPERVQVFLHRLLDSFHLLDFDLASLSRPFWFLLNTAFSFNFKSYYGRSKERKDSYAQKLKPQKITLKWCKNEYLH